MIRKIWAKHAQGRQTLKDLSQDFGKNSRTIRKYLDQCEPVTGEIKPLTKPIVLVIDATFFSRTDGVLIFRTNQKNLYWKEIDGEKIRYYASCLSDLVTAGFQFSAFVIDGRKGVKELLLQMFPQTPIQFCQFHQSQTITRYITRNPKLEAGKELRRLTLTLTQTNAELFQNQLQIWQTKWNSFLREKTIHPLTGKWGYTHRKLRSAARSLSNNLPWLFIYQRHLELKIPNTTNTCDGSFAHWKNKVSLHRGLRKDRRRKMINYLLENS